MLKKYMSLYIDKFSPMFIRKFFIRETFLEGTKAQDFVLVKNICTIFAFLYVSTMLLGFAFVFLGLFIKIFFPSSFLLSFSIASMLVYVILSFKIAGAERRIEKKKVNLSELGEISTFRWYHLIAPLFGGLCFFIILSSIL